MSIPTGDNTIFTQLVFTLSSHLLEHAHLCLVHERHADLVVDSGRDIRLNQQQHLRDSSRDSNGTAGIIISFWMLPRVP